MGELRRRYILDTDPKCAWKASLKWRAFDIDVTLMPIKYGLELMNLRAAKIRYRKDLIPWISKSKKYLRLQVQVWRPRELRCAAKQNIYFRLKMTSSTQHTALNYWKSLERFLGICQIPNSGSDKTKKKPSIAYDMTMEHNSVCLSKNCTAAFAIFDRSIIGCHIHICKQNKKSRRRDNDGDSAYCGVLGFVVGRKDGIREVTQPSWIVASSHDLSLGPQVIFYLLLLSVMNCCVFLL